MAAYDDLNVKRIFIVGIASIVVTAVTALAVQVLYYYLAEVNARTSASSSYTRQNNALARQTRRSPRAGVDAETGNLTIPIDQAMNVIISQSDEKSSSDET